MNKINVGIIGCGRISTLHYNAYSKIDDATIYAVCDKDEKTVKAKQKEWEIPLYFTDYKEMLKDPKIDTVEILSPQGLHKEMVISAARAGKHINLQKPMTIDLSSADEMLYEVKKAGIVFQVNDNYVFYPPIVFAKKMIDRGDIGTPQSIRIKMISGNSGGWNVPMNAWMWRLKETKSGRGMQTFDHGHHLWALSWYLLGEFEKVYSWIDSIDGIIDSPALIMWKYREGIKYGICEYVHCYEMNIPSDYYANDEWIEITGSKGIIQINRCTGKIKEGPAISYFNGNTWKYFSNIESDWSSGFNAAVSNFIDAVKGRTKPFLSGEQANEVLRIDLAISESARLGKEIFIDALDKKSAHT